MGFVLLVGLLFLWMDLSCSSRQLSRPVVPARLHGPMNDAGIRVELTPEERAYLDELGPILMAVDPDWMPFEYVTEDGDFIGIAPDLLDLIARRLGARFERIPTRDWEETLEISQAGKSHIIPFLNQTPAREEWLLFTHSFFVNPNVFVTREEHDYISDPRALQGKRIVLPKGTSIEEQVRRDFPNLEVVTVASEADTFRHVEERKADMTLRSLTMAAYVIRQEGWFNLKIAGEVPEYANHLRIGVNKEMPLLRDILNKGIATISPAEIQEAVNRYVSIQIVEGQNLRLLLRVAAIASLVLAFSLYWSHRIQKVSLSLYESERSKSILLSNLPGMAYRCKYDAHWTMDFISEGCQTLTGYPSEALVQNRDLSFNDLIAPEMREEIRLAWERAVTQKTSMRLEYKIRTKDGQERWVYEQGTPLFLPDGTVECLEGLIIDITERKQLENLMREAQREAEAAVKVKSRFLAMMSHEIRTPLNGITGMSRMLLDSGLSPEQRRNAEIILESGGNLLEIINDILEFSRLEAGKVKLEIQPFSLRTFFETLTAVFERNAREKGLELQVDLDDAVPEHVEGDPKRLRQIFTNLLGNAIKFTEEGSVRIHVAPGDAAGWLVFRVKDTGCGIPTDQQQELFEEFVQANNSTYRKHGGSGLGLSICKQLVEVMGGAISLSSTPGMGSEFRVDLNLPETLPPPPAPPLPAHHLEGSLRHLEAHALVVEDHPVNRAVTRAILEKLGLNVTVATDGFDAQEKLAAFHPDLVLMDVEMPGMDGCEVTRLLRRSEGEASPPRTPLPVVAMTAHDDTDILQRCRDAGMTDILIKPVNPERLHQLLSSLLRSLASDKKTYKMGTHENIDCG